MENVEYIDASSRSWQGNSKDIPFLARLFKTRIDNDSLRAEHNCGATIISSCWILTAAHCFTGDLWDFNDGELVLSQEKIRQSYRVVVGRDVSDSDLRFMNEQVLRIGK